ncbi:MAG: hypothetical protein KBC06_00470 [Candidatus Pacebacteria bacterium]|nr:hypothetical protein [Candidatus Paceibacterota bacterium]
MIPEQVAYLPILISSVGISFYVRDIIRGNTKPNLVSWFLWFLAPVIGGFLQIKDGAGLSVIPVLVAGFVCIPVLVTALIKRNVIWKISLLDVVCGILSALALIFWITTRRTEISILFAILSDALAAVPTLIKSWKFPETESSLGYIPGVINNGIGLMFIKDWRFSIYSFGVYLILLNLTLITFIYRKKIILTYQQISAQ